MELIRTVNGLSSIHWLQSIRITKYCKWDITDSLYISIHPTASQQRTMDVQSSHKENKWWRPAIERMW